MNLACISVDSFGNIHAGFNYTANPLTVYNSDGTTFTTFTNSGSSDGVVVKYNSVGTAQWAIRFGGTGFDSCLSVTSDSSGNVHVFGNYKVNQTTIYNSDGTTFATLINAGGASDGFIVKYDQSGMAQWATRISGTGSESNDWSKLSLDSDGNVYIATGYTTNPLTLYNSDGTSFASTLANSGLGDGLIAKYNSSGTVQWVTRIGSVSGDVLRGISPIDSSGNFYVVGYSNGAPIVYNSDGSVFNTLAKQGNSCGILIKYDSLGMAQWATQVPGSGSDQTFVNGITLDSNELVYIFGSYFTSTSLTFYNSDGTTGKTLTNSGLYDTFAAKYSPTGKVQWAAKVAGTKDDHIYGISTEPSGTFYVVGIYLSNPVTIY